MSTPPQPADWPFLPPSPSKGPEPRESGRQLCKLLMEGETHNVVVSHKGKEDQSRD